MKVIAVIPARGGSKGIPGKNIRIVAGRPLISYTIEAALKVQSIDRVIVSTDSDEIKAVAETAGAEVFRRPDEISGDLASSEEALIHVLETLKQKENYLPDLLVFLQCTSPLTVTGDIEKTVEKLIREKADCALTVAPFHYFLWRYDPVEGAVGINHNKRNRPMRQQREPQYLETGAVYVMRTEGFIKHRHRFFGRVAMEIVPVERWLEIDDPADLEIAEFRLKNLQVKGD
ncbi:MAG: acylneuraminate cytidylyltransferase family protein [Promethearchaeota archaeon]